MGRSRPTQDKIDQEGFKTAIHAAATDGWMRLFRELSEAAQITPQIITEYTTNLDKAVANSNFIIAS